MASVTSEKSPNVYKLPKNYFTGKIIDFDIFSKIALKCGHFGKNICCNRV